MVHSDIIKRVVDFNEYYNRIFIRELKLNIYKLHINNTNRYNVLKYINMVYIKIMSH